VRKGRRSPTGCRLFVSRSLRYRKQIFADFGGIGRQTIAITTICKKASEEKRRRTSFQSTIRGPWVTPWRIDPDCPRPEVCPSLSPTAFFGDGGLPFSGITRRHESWIAEVCFSYVAARQGSGNEVSRKKRPAAPGLALSHGVNLCYISISKNIARRLPKT
jgi:hypothetical protein